MLAGIALARAEFHRSLLENVLFNDKGVLSNADKDSTLSKLLARSVADQIGESLPASRLVAQTSGAQFETICEAFLRKTFALVDHLRPGDWVFTRSGSAGIGIGYQYRHLLHLRAAAAQDRTLSAALGRDYVVKPDLLILRVAESDERLNQQGPVVGDDIPRYTPLRLANSLGPIIHASISCKWTLRSDRAQNARTEALQLIRLRKGHVPHIVVVTGEPLPSRIASLSLGTGDIDAVYHFALYELLRAVAEHGNDDSKELMATMVDGHRLKDISDLPFDLAL